MKFETIEINGFEEFLDMEHEWNLLLSKSHYNVPFLRHEWLRLWWSHFGHANKLVIILVRKAGCLVFAIPLMEVKKNYMGVPFIILQSMTNSHSCRYHFMMMPGEEDAVKSFWDYLRNRKRKWHLLQLRELPSDISQYEMLLRIAREDNCRADIWPMYESPYLPLQSNWDEYFSSLKRKFRSNYRNRSKRLNQLGEVTCELIDNPNDITGELSKGFEIEKKSWKGESGTAIGCDPNLTSFYSQWAKVAFEQKWLQLSFLKVNGNSVAFDYSIEYEDRLYCMKIGYDPEYSPYSVGQLLCGESIKRSFENNLIEYDFLGETTVQKRDWTGHSKENIWLFIYNCNWKSQISYLYRFWLKRNLKRRIVS